MGSHLSNTVSLIDLRDLVRDYWSAETDDQRELKTLQIVASVTNLLDLAGVQVWDDPMNYQEFVERMFDALNAAFFEGVLPRPLLFASPIKTTDYTPVAGMFHDPKTSLIYDEPAITINPDENKAMQHRFGFSSVYVVMAESLIHEMTHYYCYLNGIEDVDETGSHNENFQQAAREHGQECEAGENGLSTTGITLESWIRLDAYLDDDLRDALEMA